MDLYNKAYQAFTPDKMLNDFANIELYLKENNKSLINYLKTYFAQFGSLEILEGKSVLELGCGLGGLTHFLSQYTDDITGVDISSLAIMNANEIAAHKQLVIKFIAADVCENSDLNKKFDYIIDSHLLHCLTSQSDRMKYYSFVKKHLKPGGLFLCETMAYNEEIQEPLGYELTTDNVLLKEIEGELVPIRTIHRSLDLENELNTSGFKINYFYYHHELSFNVFSEYDKYPEFRLPRTIRLSAQSI